MSFGEGEARAVHHAGAVAVKRRVYNMIILAGCERTNGNAFTVPLRYSF
jgi:hypothetical protein